MTDEVRFVCHIEKSEPDQRRFWGKAYIHQTADGALVEDWSGDVIDTPETRRELEEAFYGFVKDYRTGDAEHEVFDAATMIEGYVVTHEKITAGLFPGNVDEGVYVAFEANNTPAGDALWKGVKDGTLKALSIVGSGWREDA